MTIDDTIVLSFLFFRTKRKILETELKEMVTVRTKSSFKDHMGWIFHVGHGPLAEAERETMT